MNNSYKSIIKSNGLIGFVQVSKMFFGLIRNKVIAVLLGTQGFGVWSLYMTYLEMVNTFSTLGLDKSGVREISKISDDEEAVAKCIYVFRRTLLVSSSFFALLSIIFSKTISRSLFDSSEYAIGIVIVSFAIIFNSVSKGQVSILNGLRDLKGLALSQILGSFVGTVSTIIFVYWLGIDGIPFYLFLVGLTLVMSTWWFVRKLRIPVIKPEFNEYKKLLFQLVKLGLGFSIAGIIFSFMTYLSKVYLSQNFDVEVVGIYQASWTISNLYVGILLTAMGIDFMPRLMKVIDSEKRMNTLINEQMELGLLVSSIGIIFVLFFAPLILQVLYSKSFVVGEEIIRWQILGVSLRVLGFPFSHTIMAREKPIIYVLVQSLFSVSDYLLIIFFSNLYGFDGLGINYFIAYLLYLSVTGVICYKMFSYKPSMLLLRIILIVYSIILGSWIVTDIYSGIYINILGIIVLLVMSWWIDQVLKKNMSISLINMILKKIKKSND
ncbi:O-antigen translocase [Gracilimonas mengyeensis]|uniref:Polysaccharide transporter, PST family n=1 Tax=Gracilimonas mengyeensis TaxID=1302730 RepID=A0A521FKW8_9BACT|nr:O-antigen translocase [Gracilimonas mengyeensis]SMO96769.1 polysaccharide transporter, PST family [Gracilimonas mengyeensis]